LSGLPGDIGRASRPTLGLAPGGGCRAAGITPDAGALLPHRFTLACAAPRSPGAPPSAVCSLWPCPTGHPVLAFASTLALWSPDFPRRRRSGAAATRPAHRRPLRLPARVAGANPPGPGPRGDDGPGPRSSRRRPALRAQVAQHREHPLVVGLRLGQVELHEDVADVLLDRPGR